ncbi:MAG: low specificity L-threonine aldolase [Bacteroidales bacterium]|nr:low specificity L-threonine aldolase [Bacteroidales bacterium]
MIRLDCDYMEGAHPKVLQKLIETNEVSTPGYGNDAFTAAAKDKVRLACGCSDADVYFLIGGTQTNATVIDALLARHEGVIAAESGHINVHESGAIEATGHKVLVLPQHEGKLKAEEVEKFIDDFYADETYEHMVAPGMVYISNSTEYGTVYTLEELADLSTVCEQAGIPLYMDGARLAYALAAEGNDVTLNDVARLCDVFYIGGTKVGALFGEAVVASPGWLPYFTPLVKQHGALLAKGRLLGVQFDALFTDGLYEEIGRHAVAQAIRIRDAFTAAGYPPFIPSPTNQQFFRLPNEVIDSLSDAFTFEYWGPRGETDSDIRIVTSWATRPSDVDAFISRIQSL